VAYIIIITITISDDTKTSKKRNETKKKKIRRQKKNKSKQKGLVVANDKRGVEVILVVVWAHWTLGDEGMSRIGRKKRAAGRQRASWRRWV
jgi:hypothetical protein